MNQTIKEAMVRSHRYDSHEQLHTHLADFVAAYNFARCLKSLRGHTPYEAIGKACVDEANHFGADPQHQMPGPNPAYR